MMEWFEQALDLSDFDDEAEENDTKKKQLLICVLSNSSRGEYETNELLYRLQKKLTDPDFTGQTTVEKAFLYGDGRVLKKSFEETVQSKIYYMDCLAKGVPDSHLLILAHAWMNSLPDTPYVLIIRESEYGMLLAEELVLEEFFKDRTLNYRIGLLTDSLKNDWLERFVASAGGRTARFSEFADMCEDIIR